MCIRDRNRIRHALTSRRTGLGSLAGLYLGYGDGPGPAHTQAAATVQAVLGTDGLSRSAPHLEDVHGADVDALATAVAQLLVDVDQIDLVLDWSGTSHVGDLTPDSRSPGISRRGTADLRLSIDQPTSRSLTQVYQSNKGMQAHLLGGWSIDAHRCSAPSSRFFLSAVSTISDVTGNRSNCTPMASAMAFTMAGAGASCVPSPASLAPNGPIGSSVSMW